MLAELDRAERERLAELLDEQERRQKQRRFYEIFPDETQFNPDGSVRTIDGGLELYGRHLYPKQLEFFRVSADYREVAFQAANRVGKTQAGCYADTAHLTGEYPHWWEGKRFTAPIRAWIAGKTYETTRDTLQVELLGPVTGGGAAGKSVAGTGMIPGHLLAKPSWRSGVTDLVDTIKVRHVSGGWSTLSVKSYQQGRGSFEGTAQHLIHLDEEDEGGVGIYGECLTRTATTNGLLMLTYTPLLGISETVKQFMQSEA